MLQWLSTKDNSLIIITHYFTILDYIPVDHVYLMQKGEIIKEGSAALAQEVKANGFNI
jgi:Fe-S cluster assembly ATP-binding protein